MVFETGAPTPRGEKLISIDGILRARPQMPITSTRDRGWGGVTVDLHPPYYGCAESFSGLDHHLISYYPSGSARLVQRRDGVVHQGGLKSGFSLVMPAGHPSGWEGDSGLSARLRVPVSLVEEAAGQLGRHALSRIEVRNVFAVYDPVIGRLVQAFLAEMEMPPHPCQVLIVDALSAAISAHLIRRYNAFGVADAGGLRVLGRLELVRLTAFIEENLNRSISLDDLANQVNVSRFHFCRIFKKSTGLTAFGFVEQCRIRRAQVLIIETDLSLAEVSLMTGFSDQSHFTRRFHFHMGCTPAVYAREHGRRRSARRGTAREP